MLGVFQEREDRLVMREAELKNRLQALAVADTEIERKLAALTKAEAQLRETIALAETAAEKRPHEADASLRKHET